MALSFDAFTFFATNTGMPTTAPGIATDRIAHLYYPLGGEPTGEPTHDDLMVGKAGTRTSYYSSGDALIANHPLPSQCLAMVGCCVLC
jgi:hypothetical protein